VTPLVAPLFVPGDRPEQFPKAAATGTDMVIIDLEDAVSKGAKELARKATVDYLSGGAVAIVRVNSPSTAEFRDDLAALSRGRPAAIMVPKFERAVHAEQVRSVFGESIPIVALIETPAAFRDLPTLLKEGRVAQAAVGTMDLAAELECMPDSKTIEHARCTAVMASLIAGIARPLDGITANVADAEAAAYAARESRSLGFHGKLCIHPRQVRPVQEAFLPSVEEIDWARSIVSQTREGVAMIDGEMIDIPIIRRAQRILRQASAKHRPQDP
jgi:citrate lyase subunit beta / citryl-CoA lyase